MRVSRVSCVEYYQVIAFGGVGDSRPVIDLLRTDCGRNRSNLRLLKVEIPLLLRQGFLAEMDGYAPMRITEAECRNETVIRNLGQSVPSPAFICT